MAILSASEVFGFAIRVEENGERFYKSFSDRFKESIQRELFSYLAKEEGKHRETFEQLSKEVVQETPPTSYPDEYLTYLQAYADGLIFTDSALEREVERISGAKEACEFGIRRELDSILYYQEIKTFVPEHERDLIDSIISEERGHFVKLTDMKKKLQ